MFCGERWTKMRGAVGRKTATFMARGSAGDSGNAGPGGQGCGLKRYGRLDQTGRSGRAVSKQGAVRVSRSTAARLGLFASQAASPFGRANVPVSPSIFGNRGNQGSRGRSPSQLLLFRPANNPDYAELEFQPETAIGIILRSFGCRASAWEPCPIGGAMRRVRRGRAPGISRPPKARSRQRKEN
jgi:hypothetical protein